MDHQTDLSNFKSKVKSKALFRKPLLIGRILEELDKESYAEQIAEKVELSKVRVGQYINKLIKLNFIRQLDSYPKTYSLLPDGKKFLTEVKLSSLRVTDKLIRLHHLTLKFPIVKDNPTAKFDEFQPVNNWIKGRTKLSFPIGITIERQSDKSIMLYFHQFDTTNQMFITDFLMWVIKGLVLSYDYLTELGIKIDVFAGESISQHIANETAQYETKIDKKITTEIDLGRVATSIFPADFDAKAWIDFSKKKDKSTIMDLETNDLTYQEKILRMPETISNLDRDNELMQKFLVSMSKTNELNSIALMEILKKLKK